MSLYSSHLPLDANPQVGNNFKLAEFIGLNAPQSCMEYKGNNIGCLATNGSGLKMEQICKRLSELEGASSPLSVDFGPAIPKKILIVTGSAADSLYHFESLGFDTLITGEPKQFAYHFAKERGLNAIFAGHYATETLGVKAVGNLLENQFNIKSNFINVPTGI